MKARTFTLDDQISFARLSGDWNPIHIDPIFARRTAAGRPAVHGVHLLLHSLDQLAAAGKAPVRAPALVVKFQQFVLISEIVEIRVVDAGTDMLDLLVTVDGAVRATITCKPCTLDINRPAPIASTPHFDPREEAMALIPALGTELAGHVSSASPPADWAALFPNAAKWLGSAYLAEIGTTTRLIGMICPGLNSVYLDLRADPHGADTESESASISFAMRPPRHNLIAGTFVGARVSGSLKSLIRAAAVTQPDMAAIKSLVPSEAFKGDRVLVIGGTRGLGEVSAKLLAAGGADVFITYASGQADAQRVADDIKGSGAFCEMLKYRADHSASDQLQSIATPITHAYYFATPTIARPKSRLYNESLLNEFNDIFNRAFADLVGTLRDRYAAVSILYPSTTYVEKRPRGLVEYAMAKAAGEILCAEMNITLKPLHIRVVRFPPLATDQNIAASGVTGSNPVDMLLPELLALHAHSIAK